MKLILRVAPLAMAVSALGAIGNLASACFNRKSYDATLHPHKNKSGWDCAGRTGLYMGTR